MINRRRGRVVPQTRGVGNLFATETEILSILIVVVVI